MQEVDRNPDSKWVLMIYIILIGIWILIKLEFDFK